MLAAVRDKQIMWTAATRSPGHVHTLLASLRHVYGHGKENERKMISAERGS
jgi:hypothetical protein